MKKVRLDGRLLTTKNRLYDTLDEAFDFPDYFGRNLDALWDVLTEESEPTEIHFSHTAPFLENMDGYGEKVLKMFGRLSEWNACYDVHFYPHEAEEE